MTLSTRGPVTTGSLVSGRAAEWLPLRRLGCHSADKSTPTRLDSRKAILRNRSLRSKLIQTRMVSPRLRNAPPVALRYACGLHEAARATFLEARCLRQKLRPEPLRRSRRASPRRNFNQCALAAVADSVDRDRTRPRLTLGDTSSAGQREPKERCPKDAERRSLANCGDLRTIC